MPTPTVYYDTIKPSDVVSSMEGVVWARGFTIRPAPILSTSTPTNPDSGVLLKCLPLLPPIGSGITSTDPSVPSDLVATLICTKHEFKAIDAVANIIYGTTYYSTPLINGGAGPIEFNNGFTVGSEDSYATADGSLATSVWYQSGYSKTSTTMPTGSYVQTQSVPVTKIVADQTLAVKLVFNATFWLATAATWRAAAARINSDTWGSDPRGTWLFWGPQAVTYDLGNTYTVIATFSYKLNGWYPFGEYIDPNAQVHPPDSGVVQTLLGMAPPPVGGAININGLARFSEQYETSFNNLFTPFFTPLGLNPLTTP